MTRIHGCTHGPCCGGLTHTALAMDAGQVGLPVVAILDSIDAHGPYYGASSPEAGTEGDVFGFAKSASDAQGQWDSTGKKRMCPIALPSVPEMRRGDL